MTYIMPNAKRNMSNAYDVAVSGKYRPNADLIPPNYSFFIILAIIGIAIIYMVIR